MDNAVQSKIKVPLILNQKLVEQKLGTKTGGISLTSKIKEYASVIPRGNKLSRADKRA